MRLPSFLQKLSRNQKPRSQSPRQRARLSLELLEDRAVPATLNVTGLGAGGWLSDDTRNTSGTNLVGDISTHAGAGTATAADDLAIALQLKFVSTTGLPGATYGGAVSLDGTSSNSGKTSFSTIDIAAGHAASSVLVDAGFTAEYQWLSQGTRTSPLKLGIQSTDFGSSPGESQEGFVATRSGESAWDLILVQDLATPVANVWNTSSATATSGNWFLFAQAGNTYFNDTYNDSSVTGLGGLGSRTLEEWNALETSDSGIFWGDLLFGAGAKITSVQFGIGSGQRDAVNLVDYAQISFLNGGDVIDFGSVQTVYVDQAADFVLTFDADDSGDLTAGDRVTWNPLGTAHAAGIVTNLTFGLNAFASIQDGVDGVALDGTVNVAAGTYTENVIVNKSATLLGANAGTPGNDIGRVAESIVAGGTGIAIDIQADNVSVDGFRMTGLEGVRSLGFDSFTVQNNYILADAVGIDLQGVSTDASGFTVQDNSIALSAQLAGSTATVGVVLAGIGGSFAPVIVDNDIADAGIGYFLYSVNTTPTTSLEGGQITGVMQGVVVLNADPINVGSFASTSFVVDGITMTEFAGTDPGNPSRNFHAGVYVFTGGNDSSKVITGTVRNVNIKDTGKISPDSAALYFADFSTESGIRQDISVEMSTIEDNRNRGMHARGGNAVVDVTQSTFTNNGFDPFGTDGNDGFGIIAREGATVTVSETFITNPEIQAGAFPVYALAADTAAKLTVFNSSIDNNDNASGKLAINSATLDASGNWWGTNVAATIAAGMTGLVDFTPFLHSSADTAVAAGFQGDFSNVHVTALGAQTAGDRINEGIVAVTAGGIVNIHSGTYAESINTPANTPGKVVTLAPEPGPGQVTVDDLILDGNITLQMEIDGVTFDQFVVNDAVTLGGAKLDLQILNPFVGTVKIIDNDLADDVDGTFAGKPNNTIFLASGTPVLINYDGGDGNDVVISSTSAAAVGDKLTFIDDDGDEYTVQLKGKVGQLAVVQSDPDNNGQGPIASIAVFGTNSKKNSLLVKVKRNPDGGDGKVNIGAITGDTGSGLKTIDARRSDLDSTLGNGIQLDGALGKLRMQNVLADIDVASLTSATFSGGISDSVWTILGGDLSIKAKGNVNNWDLDTGGSIRTAKLGLVNNSTLDVATSVRSFKASVFMNSHLFVGFTPLTPDPFNDATSADFSPGFIKTFTVGVFINSTIAAD